MMLPKGFYASGVEAGIKPNRPDLALVHIPDGANAAAIFTTNLFKAAPVVLSRAALKKSGGMVRALLVNAGCANAMTGVEGMNAARRVRSSLAGSLGCLENEVFLMSTGTIGMPYPEDKVERAIPMAVTRLSASGLDAVSRAILTTDVGPKVATASYLWKGKKGKIVGVAKGAGMIHPNMATMLSFVMTDADASPEFLKMALKSAADESYHAISVDGDTSTNDTVLLMASGKLGGPRMTDLKEAADFRNALVSVCKALAYKIVRDGEGASRVMDISIDGARSDREAKLAAYAVATSPLVKTALHGGDPNWGRIMAAVGRSGARFSPGRSSLTVGNIVLVEKGEPAKYSEKAAAKIFSRERVPVNVDLGSGDGKAFLITSDLGHDYVTLNADYRT